MMALCLSYHWTPADIWRMTARQVGIAVEYLEKVSKSGD